MKKVLLAAALIAAFYGGRTLGNLEGHRDGLKDGRVSAFYDVSMDGYMVYLGCLDVDCSDERAISDYVVGIADRGLEKEGVKP